MSPQTEARMVRVAHFPLELLVIAALGVFTYGRALAGCSSTSAAPQGSAGSMASATTSAGRLAP